MLHNIYLFIELIMYYRTTQVHINEAIRKYCLCSALRLLLSKIV